MGTRATPRPTTPCPMQMQKMQLIVRLPPGNTITLHVNATFTISVVKALVKLSKGTPRFQQRLIFNEEELEDVRTSMGYGIPDGDEIKLLLRVGGGGKRGLAIFQGQGK